MNGDDDVVQAEADQALRTLLRLIAALQHTNGDDDASAFGSALFGDGAALRLQIRDGEGLVATLMADGMTPRTFRLLDDLRPPSGASH